MPSLKLITAVIADDERPVPVTDGQPAPCCGNHKPLKRLQGFAAKRSRCTDADVFFIASRPVWTYSLWRMSARECRQHRITKQADVLTLFYLLPKCEIIALLRRLGYAFEHEQLLQTAALFDHARLARRGVPLVEFHQALLLDRAVVRSSRLGRDVRAGLKD